VSKSAAALPAASGSSLGSGVVVLAVLMPKFVRTFLGDSMPEYISDAAE
jgi:hypothetical protein